MKRPWANTRTIKKDTLVRILLRGEMGAENVWQDELLANHTSFRVGGPADWMLRAKDTESLIKAVQTAQRTKLPYRIIGAGSNILVSDAGVEGILILNKASSYELIEHQHGFALVVDAGMMLPRLAGELAKKGVAGLEWGVGIPGTIGGAIVQNAGAWGHDIKERLLSIEYMMPDNDESKTLSADKLGLSYRHSNILDALPEKRPIILTAWFRLDHGNPDQIAARNAEYIAQRKASQPKEPSGGSTFRNPEGDYAGRLIEAAGLKGYRIGNAAFSPKHANFIVNHGQATSEEIRQLIEMAQKTVYEKFGVELEPEIEFLGYWGDDTLSVPDERTSQTKDEQ